MTASHVVVLVRMQRRSHVVVLVRCKDGVTPVVESGMIDSEFINVHEDNQFYGMMIEAMAND